MIFTSGGKRVFLKEKFWYIGFTDNPFQIEFASKASQKYKLLLLKLLYAPFQEGRSYKTLDLPKTLIRLKTLNIDGKSRQCNNRDNQHPPSLYWNAPSDSLFTEGYQAKAPHSLLLSKKSMSKRPRLEKYRENRENRKMKTLAFSPAPSQANYR